MKKKILSILLALSLCLPPLALAEETGTKLTSASFLSSHTLTGSDDANNPAAYHLDADVTIDTTITVTGYVALDLNGHVLKYENASVKGSVITVGDGTTAGHLTLTDSRASDSSATHKFRVDSAKNNLWVLDDSGDKTVTGGIITGGTGSGTYVNGGGVFVDTGSSFTMSSGNIVGCTSTNGGGVYIDNNGTFNMSGGTITNCTTTNGSGGGVYVSGGSLTMSGTAKIENCSATATVTDNGGGVYVINSGSFAMKGGTISGCTATGGGGGVYVSEGSFTMSGTAKIENCSAADGGGVWVSEGTFSMTGGSITGCSATGADAKGGAVFGDSGNITITGPTEGNKTLSIGGDVAATSCRLTVSGNVTVEGKLTVSNQDATGLVRLSGGTFTGGIERTDSASDSNGCFALLPNDGLGDSYVYQQKTGDASDWTTLENSAMKTTTTLAGSVRVVKCTHDASNNGACLYCGQGFAADVTKSGSTTMYPSLEAALAVANGGTVKLLQDISIPEDFELPAGTYTLDVNGKKLTYGKLDVNGNVTLTDSLATVTDGSVTYAGSVTLNNSLTVNGALTLEKVKLDYDIDKSFTVNVASGALIANAGTLINGNVTVGSGGSATINGGTFKGSISVAEGKTVASLLPARKIFVTGGAYQDSGSRQIIPAAGGAISVLPQPFEDLTVTAASGVTGTQNGGFSWNYGEVASFSVCATDILTAPTQSPVILTGTYTLKQGEAVKQTGSISTAIPGTSWIAKASHFDGTAALAQAATLQISGSSLSAGSYTLEIKATSANQSGYYETISVPVTVKKGTITADDYGTPDPMTDLTYNAREQELVSASAIQLPPGAKYLYSLDGTNWKENVSDIKGKDAKSYTVYWKVDGGTNYNDLTNTTPVRVTIKPKNINANMETAIVNVSVPNLTYNGQPQTPSPVLKLNSKGDNGSAVVEYERLTAGTDYTVTVTPQTNVGSYTATITGKGNYTGTQTVSWRIEKADHDNQTANGSAKFGTTGTVDLSNLIMSGGTAEVKTTTDTDSVLSGTPSVDGKTLKFTFKDEATANQTATIKVSVTNCTNYNDYDITVTVKVNEKDVPIVSANDINVTYTGSEIPVSAITGTATFGDQTVAGSWSFTNAAPKNVSDSSDSVSVTFTPTDTANYSMVATIIKVTINKATPTGTPTYTAITTSGKKLTDAALAIGTITPAGGIIAWELDDDTEVTANTAYNWTYTPAEADQANYTTLTGSITPYPVSSGGGGGGGGGSKPTTPSTPSTSITVPVTSDTASVEVKAEVSKDGTATVEVSDKQIEQVASNGSGTVTVDVSGVKDVESVQVPSHVVETTNKAEETGLTVTMPTGSVALDETALDSVSTGEDVTVSVKRVPATDLNEAQQAAVGDMANIGIVVDVDVFVGSEKQSNFNGGKLTISVPYTPKKNEDPSKMTVWYIKDDGTIQPMGGSYDAEKKCFVFETTHLSRYVIVSVEDMPTFTDVPEDAYYADAVTWAVLNGITTGMTETTFGPDVSCTRAQIVTFLWRAAGQPEVTGSNPFSDVNESDYFYQAVLWAVENKITTGTTATTFAPEDTCTRAQAAAFIYRNEQANGNGFTDNWAFQLPFTDVPEWCYEAVAWCYMNGVTQGTSETTFSPDLDCSRAQIVTMLYRVSEP